MTNQNYIRGGVVNKTAGKDNFDSIVSILKHERCEITYISFSSLKGFVFKVHVPNLTPDQTEFYGLNENTKIFDVPVDTFVLKMAILYSGESTSDTILTLPIPYQSDNPRYNPIPKEMERFANFHNEATTQSEIYEQTLSKGQPICPALIDLSHFTNLDSSIPFLKALEKKCKDDESITMLDYITNILTSVHDCQLGMITMESAIGFESFYEVYDNFGEMKSGTMQMSGHGKTPPSTNQTNLCIDVIVQIIRLLNETRIVHCDLHGENILIDKRSKKIVIIDFGLILKIDHLNLQQRRIAQQFAKDAFFTHSFFNEMGNYELSKNIRENVFVFDKNYAKTITQFIISIDYMFNKYNFNVMQGSKIQNWYKSRINFKSYGDITNKLNSYYSSEILCSLEEKAKYKKIKESGKHEGTQKFETLCEKLNELKPSPGRYKFTARDAPEVNRSKKEKTRHQYSSSRSRSSRKKYSYLKSSSSQSVYSFPNVIGKINFGSRENSRSRSK
jgi:serine/threonine protein kinase